MFEHFVCMYIDEIEIYRFFVVMNAQFNVSLCVMKLVLNYCICLKSSYVEKCALNIVHYLQFIKLDLLCFLSDDGVHEFI